MSVCIVSCHAPTHIHMYTNLVQSRPVRSETTPQILIRGKTQVTFSITMATILSYLLKQTLFIVWDERNLHIGQYFNHRVIYRNHICKRFLSTSHVFFPDYLTAHCQHRWHACRTLTVCAHSMAFLEKENSQQVPGMIRTTTTILISGW